ncbi:hypothetical protein Bca52824_034954 [Brassica carinata]|uniref:Uncharacterized protein n=1 Tax=Brassica carinata TaxID=52824 RepID=A0A8X7S2H8_BRACI|nr:hypothetical protein Bca52824_034954 [Brassica carinata]
MQVYHRKVQTNNGQDVPLGDITNSVPIPSKDSRCQRRILMSQKRKHPMPSLESMQVETVTQSQNLVQTIGTAPSQVINPRGQGQSRIRMPTIQQTCEPPRKKTTSAILKNPQTMQTLCSTPTSDASESTNCSSYVHNPASQHTQTHIMETSSTLNSLSNMRRAPINEQQDSDSSESGDDFWDCSSNDSYEDQSDDDGTDMLRRCLVV